MQKIVFLISILISISLATWAQKTIKEDSISNNWTSHFQLTAIEQYHGKYHFPYTGPSSLDSNSERNVSLTSTLFLGRRLWKNAAIYFNPEMVGGSGFSGSKGAAGFPNGEIYRVGNPTPSPFLARLFFQQIFALKGSGYSFESDDRNQIQGQIPDSRITLHIGKFCLADFFDDNAYDHEARSQFLNWSLMANGAWDFAADTKGYTGGLEIELIKPNYSLKFAIAQMSKTANSTDLDFNFLRSNALGLEFSKNFKIFGRTGIIRITGYRNSSRAPRYDRATQALLRGDSSYLFILSGQKIGTTYGGLKYGYGINLEQMISKNLGAFFRYGWNDGKTGSWEFTDIDNNIQIGLNLEGKAWGRNEDALGLALANNGISKDHQAYLAAGGYSFIIGDGHLNYGREEVFESYYRAKLSPFIFVSGDYQLILNPGYNQDRKGPISIPAIRIHIKF